MDGDRRGGSLRGRSNSQFKRKGGGNKKGRRNDSRPEHRGNAQVPNPTDTVYRILCPSRNIGYVIGKGGGIIKVLREETKSKITVSDTFPGSDERVIMIYSPPEKLPKDEIDEGSEGNEGNEDVLMPPHCPAQDALLRVHNRIIEEDMLGVKDESGEINVTVTARLLVPDCLVGCLLGKGGDVIKRLRNETGAGPAGIRVLSSEHLPTCALSTDELVQIQGKPEIVKRALYEVSTLLHQNPRKEHALNYATPSRGPGFRPAGPPVGNMGHGPMWSPHHHSPHMPPPPWMDDYDRRPGYAPGRYADELPRPGREPFGEFSLKILCLDSKIGGVIGKGGMNVRQLEQETGTNIHVEDLSNQSQERVIRVSAFETLANQRSQTIDAILMLQNKASEVSDKGIITTRLLVPSSKVGCLLGQGGTIINEMRRRTQADIRVYPKEEKPECASENEELVQVSGSFAVAKDCLAEMALRLRERYLKDAVVDIDSAPPRPAQGYGPPPSFSRGPNPSGPIGFGPSGSYNAGKGGVPGYGSPGYPVQPTAARYPNPTSSIEPHYQSNAVESAPGTGGSIYASRTEAAETKPDSTHHNHNIPHQSPYPDPKAQAAYHSATSQQQQPAYPTPYQNHQQPPYQQHQTSYQNPQQTQYQPTVTQPSPYPSYQPPIAQPNAYQPSYQSTVPDQSSYQPSYPSTAAEQIQYPTSYQPTATQNPYENTTAQTNAYQSATTQGGYQY